MHKQAGTIELIISKAKPGFTRQEVVSTAESLSTVVQPYPGFISRALAIAEASHEWVDIVYWTDMASALKAAEAVMQNETYLKVFSMIEKRDMQPVHIFQKTGA